MGWARGFLECAKLFQKAGQFKYFEKNDGYNSELSYWFSQGLEKNTVLFNTLKIELTRDFIAESANIANEGEFWFKKVPFTFNSQNFLLPNVVPDWGKGVHVQNFKHEWREPIKILQSYITCEGRYASIFKYHIRFLQHLSHESKMNLPFLFLKILQKMSSRVREHQDHTKQSIFHHGLIKFIISTVLQKKGKNWDYFLFQSGFQSEKEDQ